MDSSNNPITSAVISTECRKDSNSATIVDDISFPASETKDQKAEPDSTTRTDHPGKSGKNINKSSKSKKHRRTKKKAGKKARAAEDSDSSTSAADSEDSAASDSDSPDSDSDSDKEIRKRRTRNSKKHHVTKVRTKHPRNGQKQPTRTAAGSDSESDASSSEEEKGRSSKRGKGGKIGKHLKALQSQISQLQNQLSQSQLDYGGQLYTPGVSYSNSLGYSGLHSLPPHPGNSTARLASPAPTMARDRAARNAMMRGRPGRTLPPNEPDLASGDGERRASRVADKRMPKPGGRPEYKRVDWVWDSSLFCYKLQDTTETKEDSLYNGYIFHVRRTFDCEGRYRQTLVDIKSKLLRECLQDVMGNIKGVSLVDETPKMDPNLLFLYLEEFRLHLKHLKQAKPAGDDKQERKKNQKRLENKRSQLKVLIKYLDTDYAKVKESLYPMLASGLITFELLWALWKPNTLAYSPTYGCQEEARVFKVEMAERHHTIIKGEVYFIEGRYIEFDGKRFGYGSLCEDIPEFQGARKITSLPFYPLKYHKDEALLRRDLVERGKKFVSLSGVHYKSYSGMAFLKRKKNQVVKFNIQQSRIMVDPAIFRRINPNYSVSLVRPKDHDFLSTSDSSDSEVGDCGCDSDDSSDVSAPKKTKYFTKLVKDDRGNVHMIPVTKDELESQDPETLGSLPAKSSTEVTEQPASDPNSEDTKDEEKEPIPELTDEDYLIASPVVLGFSFSEKQWLEFAVSGVKEIKWNDKAWDSLVLEPKTKDLIQALVKSRKYNAAQTIDDVIQGKGKGLVTVLHGPPGTGKTLTAEGISELLQCPLYMASAGELGTDSRFLEAELQKILDVCHAWGAILLLDEADVFLEKRNMHDIHRNALVSIFLRQLEYFQGILFLTTNRVETFDEAFQSRIHVALKYESLDTKAKKAIFKMFIDRVKALGKLELKPFTEEDFASLAKHELNGREIKNVVGSAQDLAVNKNELLGMQHIRQVLDVHDKFGRDLRGGTGYEDAMRSYF